MHCPRCKYPNFLLVGTCPQCGFHGDPDQIEELSRLTWLLGEINAWVERGIAKRIPQRIYKYYLDRFQNIQARLGLYYETFSESEALEAWPELRRYELLFQQTENWLKAGLLKTGFLPTYYSRLIELRARVGSFEGPLYPESNEERLEEVNFLLDAIYDLNKREEFTTPNARWTITSPLVDEKTKLEKILHPPVEVKPKVVAPPVEKIPEPQPEPVPPPPSTPRPPLRERFWRSILSERTLQALLFLGIFLLFVAAISFVIWGWKDFSAPVRVSIPIGFTVLFFGLGHVVRVRTQLHRSALALSAIAALWIPIDSYTIYANYGSPPKGWPEFWLLTSLACLIAYILAALQIQSRFFGYITGVAAGSTILAILEVGTDISRDWYTAALSVLAAVLLLSAIYLSKLANAGRWKVFAEPFRYLALWTPAILMPLTLGLRLVTRESYDAFHYAMTVNWFLGGFIFAWGAIQYRSRSLGILSAIALPVSVYMAQGALFDYTGANPAWQAFGLACLTPLYMYGGRRLSEHKEDEVLLAHGKTATRWGIVLIIVSALFALTDLTSGTAAAATHTVLLLTTILVAILWQQPRTLFAASLFSFTAATFAMSELNLSLNQLSVGWVSLAIPHILITLRLARQNLDQIIRFLTPLVIAAYVIAALAILPPALIYDGHLLSYALGNWIVLSAWGAYLAYRKQPGFFSSGITGRLSVANRLLTTGVIFHWLTVLPLPFWVWIVTKNNQAASYVLPSLLTALAWFMVILSHRLGTLSRDFRIPWRFAGLMVSVAAIVTAFINVPEGYTRAIVLLLIGILYFVDTFLIADRSEFYPAGTVTAWGLWMLLMQADADSEVITFCLGVLIAIYILAGLELERRKIKGINYHFLSPLYITAHVLALIVLFRIYIQPLNELLVDSPWTNAMQLWEAADQLLLAAVYAAFAWGRYQEWWGHIAAWLAMAGGGFIAIVYSEGHGSLAAKGALIAVVMILAERALFWWKRQRNSNSRVLAVRRLIWNLYRRPLLVAGWIASVGIIFLSLVRNLIWLGGGRIQQVWAAAGLLIIVFLYALSAFLFRKARFVWFAVLVLFAPWTILTNLGWFTSYKPTLPEFAISWVVLGWLLFGISRWLQQRAALAYVIPLKTATQILLPYSMLWAVADTRSSLYTVGLSIGLYLVSAWLNHKQAQRGAEGITLLETTKFFYPVAGLIPLWALYWLDFLVPTARHEHFGIVLLAFGSLGLFIGNRLEGIAARSEWKRAYGLPAYLVAYITLIFGIMMVAHRLEWLSLALLYAAILMLVSAWMFKSSLWLYPMSVAAALALLTALENANVPMERRGRWLIGLGAIHLIGAWLLRRNQLNPYAVPLIAMGFALIAFGLPPSSLDQVGAIWGYGSAALLYAICAFWLQQPVLLFPACALIIVPYATILHRSAIPVEYYGLSLFPGTLLSLFLGWMLDHRMDEYKDFPWEHSGRWLAEISRRLLQWWALPLYILGLGLASAAPFFAAGRSDLTALYFLFLAIIYVWAVFRFQLRLWLVLAILSTHYALAAYLDYLGFWATIDGAWLYILPLAAALLAVGLFLEKHFHEEPPTSWNRWLSGWSRPFYLFVFFDIVISEVASLRGTYAGAEVSLINGILIAIMASFWGVQDLSYLSSFLGLIALLQWRAAEYLPGITLPTQLAGLALGYGVIGFGYTLVRRQLVQAIQNTSWHSVWELPLQRSAIVISFLALGLAPYRGIDILSWSVRALFGLSFREIVEVEKVFMLIWVLSLIGLLYIAAAAVYRRMRLGYLAVAILLLSWFLYTFYINAWDTLRQLQWYAIPAGIYLLIIGYVEWLQRHKRLARWLDYVGILLLFGSLFWQTLVFGWSFALLLGAEGLIAFWWGSARRLRRFFYAGMAGVILATLGQLLNALQEINQWITFGLMGLLLVLVAIIVERRLEAIKAWQQVLETWE